MKLETHKICTEGLANPVKGFVFCLQVLVMVGRGTPGSKMGVTDLNCNEKPSPASTCRREGASGLDQRAAVGVETGGRAGQSWATKLTWERGEPEGEARVKDLLFKVVKNNASCIPGK